MKKLASIITGLFLFFLCQLDVEAASEKFITVPIESNYKEIVFTFDFSDGQSHTIFLTTPNGIVEKKIVDSDTVSISVEDAVKGTYEIVITAEKEVQVKARAECKNTSASEGNNLTISSAIVGLNVYFINGDLYVSWKDTGIGAVNVKVINPETMRILYEDKIDSTQCLVEIDDTVKQVEVYVVPTSSSKVDGSGVGYTLDVVRNVKATVIIPDYAITNQSVIEIPVKAEEPVVVFSNTNGTYSEKMSFPSGEHVYEVPITANENNIILYIVDEKNNINYYEFDMAQDLVAPKLKFSKQYDDAITSESQINITGYVTDAKTLYINNTELSFDNYGRFECTYPLEEGENSIVFCGYDAAGNKVETVLKITRQQLEKKSNLGTIIAIVVVVVVAVVALFTYKKKNGTPNEGLRPQSKEDKLEQLKEDKPLKKKVSPAMAENLKKPKKESIIKIEEEKETQAKDNERSKRMRRIKFTAETIVTCVQLGVVAVILLFVVRNTIVASGSMEPTLMTKDIVIYNKLAYIFDDVERGDIINFWSEEFGKYFSKRVIGIAGDEIEFHDGYVFINGQKCDESAYIAEDIETNCTKTFTVPDGTVFVLGDNRENSYDSRFFENPYISVEDIEGKYLGTIPWIFD